MHPVETADGSPTLYSERYREAYHPREGARAQAERLFVRLAGLSGRSEARVVEVGFGLGLNFLASLEAVRSEGGLLFFIGLEPEPVAPELLAEALARCRLAPDAHEPLLAAWERGRDFVVAGEGFVLELRFVRVEHARLPEGWADAVYYDPFSPRANPAAWSLAGLARAKDGLRPGGVLLSYAVAGWVRRNLEALGFAVERVPGELGKREWLRARRIS